MLPERRRTVAGERRRGSLSLGAETTIEGKYEMLFASSPGL